MYSHIEKYEHTFDIEYSNAKTKRAAYKLRDKNVASIEIHYQADIGFIMHVMPNEILEGNQMVIVCDLSQ